MLILPPRTKLTRQTVTALLRSTPSHTHAQSLTLTHWRSLLSINTPLDIHYDPRSRVVQGAMETAAKEEIVQQQIRVQH